MSKLSLAPLIWRNKMITRTSVAMQVKRFFPACVLIRTLRPFRKLTLHLIIRLLFSKKILLSYKDRFSLLSSLYRVDQYVPAAHSFDEYLACCVFILENQELGGAILEAGAYKGAGTAKLSLVAQASRKTLFVFDSFLGLPDHNDPIACTSMGYTKHFKKGDYTGTVREVKENVEKFGCIESCVFVEGFFQETADKFSEPLMAVFSDVDLTSSYKSCFKLFPNLVKGGKWFTQDAHIPAVVRLFTDSFFWKEEIGIEKPKFTRLTKRFGYFNSDNLGKG